MLADVALAVDLDGRGVDELALAGDDVDLLRLEQALQALELAGDDAVAELGDLRAVDALEREVDAHAGAVLHGLGDFGGVQHRLRGDAAAVEAGAPELVLLDDDGREAQLHGADRGGVAGAASAQDDDVVVVV